VLLARVGFGQGTDYFLCRTSARTGGAGRALGKSEWEGNSAEGACACACPVLACYFSQNLTD
jgi:hypothetical protein